MTGRVSPHLVAEYGYNRQQAYAICTACVQLRVSSLPDVPNAVVTALLPLDVFE